MQIGLKTAPYLGSQIGKGEKVSKYKIVIREIPDDKSYDGSKKIENFLRPLPVCVYPHYRPQIRSIRNLFFFIFLNKIYRRA